MDLQPSHRVSLVIPVVTESYRESASLSKEQLVPRKKRHSFFKLERRYSRPSEGTQ